MSVATIPAALVVLPTVWWLEGRPSRPELGEPDLVGGAAASRASGEP
jgi:hypothetical protein